MIGCGVIGTDQIRDLLVQRTGNAWDHHGQQIAKRYGFYVDGYDARQVPLRPLRYHVGYDHYEETMDFFEGGSWKVIHWMGYDLLLIERDGIARPPDDVTHFCYTEAAQSLLHSLGIEAELVRHAPLNRLEQPLPWPEEKRVAVYMPPTRHSFFRHELMRQVEQAVKGEWQFEWIEPTEKDLLEQKIDMIGVMKRCRVLLRCPERDSYSHMAAEFMMAGRVVLNTEPLPYQVHVLPYVHDIVSKLDSQPDPAAPAHYRRETDPARLFEALERVIEATP